MSDRSKHPTHATAPEPSGRGAESDAALSPARAALAAAISALTIANDRLEQAQRPLTGIDKAIAEATSREAGILRDEIAKMHDAHRQEILRWIGAGAANERPAPCAALAESERRLGAITREAIAAEEKVAIAREGHNGAAERVRAAAAQRDEALWWAAVEAAEPALAALKQHLDAALALDGRLRGLVAALREIGNRGILKHHGAMAAAGKLEGLLMPLRRPNPRPAEPEPGRRLLEALCLDPRSSF